MSHFPWIICHWAKAVVAAKQRPGAKCATYDIVQAQAQRRGLRPDVQLLTWLNLSSHCTERIILRMK